VFLIVCYLEASKRGDSRPKLECSATGRERKKRVGKRGKEGKIHVYKSCNETFGTSDTQWVNVLVFDMTDVMNDQIMDGMKVV
jgi:hypothetical protein